MLDFAYFEKHYRLTGADLRKPAGSIAIQQIIFTGKIKVAAANTGVINYFILEQLKETTLQFSKEATKVL